MLGRKKGKCLRRSRAEWQLLLAKLGSSGLGVEAFCRREAISAASFYRWRSLLSDEGNCGEDISNSDTEPVFVDLGTMDSVPSTRPRLDLKLVLGDGLTLHLVRS